MSWLRKLRDFALVVFGYAPSQWISDCPIRPTCEVITIPRRTRCHRCGGRLLRDGAPYDARPRGRFRPYTCYRCGQPFEVRLR